MDNQVGVDQISLEYLSNDNHEDTNYLDGNGIHGDDDDSNLS